jgi:putative DNA primase/helicase
MPCSPLFYTHNALDFDYDPASPEPEEWLKFLKSLWPNDPAAIDTLQEMFGYDLTSDTRQQKAFLIVGPKRSGKGTIARVLTALVGKENVASPTTGGLTTNFGMQPLIGKRVAIISDARLHGRDQKVLAERLLAITGEDSITIDRKYYLAWNGRLQTRFLLLTNELPGLADASGAVASRFIVLTLKETFFGKEDLGLEAKLLDELPGILNWAIRGWQRLIERGHFVQPKSSEDAIRELEDLGSPIKAFLRDCCNIGPRFTITVDLAFSAWREWCEKQGRDRPGNVSSFGRDLRSALPSIKIEQPRGDDGKRPRIYVGLCLK